MDKQRDKSNRVMFLKRCPRCSGDIHVNRDMYGQYRECLQCGYMADIASPGHFANLRGRASDIGDVA